MSIYERDWLYVIIVVDLSKKMTEKNVLILGGAGFLGANLARFLLKQPGVKITVIDSLDPVLESSKDSLKDILDKITFIYGDIRDSAFLKEHVARKHVIFNCAAQTSHPRSLENPILDAEINCIGTLKVLEAVRDYAKDAVLVYSSSSTVIGKAVGDVVDENHGEKPLDIYSANKGVAEKYHRIFNKLYDLKTVVLRFPNLYGPFGKKSSAFGFVNYFINLAAENKPITIYGEGEQTRNLMYVEDACEILWQAANTSKLIGETFFAAHNEHYTVKEIAEAIVSVFGGKIELVPWPEIRKRIDVDKVTISSAKLHYLTGWKPRYSLKAGLGLTLEIMKANNLL